MSDECDLCGLPLGEDSIQTDEHDFCCRGCREVHRTLDEPGDFETDLSREDPMVLEEDHERAYFRVPQMRCTSCEAFLSSRAQDLDGVEDARANYASEMVMVDYDPESLSEDRLADHLNTGGYRPQNPSESDDQRSRQVGRLIAGGFFGMMTMLWYILFIYPMYFGVPVENLLLDLTGDAGLYLYFNLFVMSGVVVFYTGWPILRGAWVGLRSAYPNMDVLIALAVLNAFFFSTIVLVQGGHEVYFDISVVVVLVVSLGRYFEGRLKQSALRKVQNLSTESVGSVRVIENGTARTVEAESLQPGNRVLVRAGEEIPVDGIIREGTGHVDESLVTGESRPVRKEEGSNVLAGSILRDGSLQVETTGDPNQTFVDLLRERMWEIQSSQFNYQKLADQLSAIFVPVVLLLAAGAFGGSLMLGFSFNDALLKAMTLLVVSCPCALGLATPMATMTAFEALLDLGVAPRSAAAFAGRDELKNLVFDKTGTITTDELTVKTEGVSPESIRRAAAVESRANHPLARSIEKLFDDPPSVTNFREHSGEGVIGQVDDQDVYVGNVDLFDRYDLTIPKDVRKTYEQARDNGSIPVLVGWEGRARDLLVLEEQVRDELDSILDYAGENSMDVTIMTGDNRRGINELVDHPALTEVYRQVKPEAKVKLVEQLQQEDPLVMVGDGKNDAPALAAADLGIAVGNRTALASNAADLVFVKETLDPLTESLRIVRRTPRRIGQNLAWAFLYNAVAIPAALLGYLNPLVAAVAMSASSLIVVLNSRRSFT